MITNAILGPILIGENVTTSGALLIYLSIYLSIYLLSIFYAAPASNL
jgi:hypothetical protein